ncbi:low affinity immunoglobulin epsilon Fc receptor-like [Poecilia formosa]|uniref:low affinity immunoglobulin epsilon Fc receptor-like n=1 Tax=Poecilia formosa TaxID=48698 RepID=UPI0007B89BE4|nr:PREDICTED: low affinity immunoglobulin epsilon Fc receptor-like [Poecilia formosa]
MKNSGDDDSNSTDNDNREAEEERSELSNSRLFLGCLWISSILVAGSIVYMNVKMSEQQGSIKDLTTEKKQLIDERQMVKLSQAIRDREDVIQKREGAIRKREEQNQKRQEATREAEEATREAEEATREAEEATREAEEATREAEEATREAEEATREGEEATLKTEEATQETEEATLKTEEATLKTEEATQEAEEATLKTEEATQETEEATQETEEATREAEEATLKTEEATREAEELKLTLGFIQKFDIFPINDFCPAKGCKPCLHDWILFQKKCYLFYDEPAPWKTWEQSRRFCQDRRADLVVINDLEEQEFVSKHVKSYFDIQWGYWLGLQQTNNTWTWVDGHVDTLGFWMKEELKTPGPKARLMPGRNPSESWNKADSFFQNKFICEHEAFPRMESSEDDNAYSTLRSKNGK